MELTFLNQVAYCGLACVFCSPETGCPGCRTGSGCGREAVCLHKKCCITRGIHGCWECDAFPCNRDMHAPERDVRLKAFVRYIRENGIPRFVERLRANLAAGIQYHYHDSLLGDYDGLGSEDAVIRLLESGKR